MRILIAVKSCCRDWHAGHHVVIRETWGRHIPSQADLRFFVANAISSRLTSDTGEVFVDGPDDYMSLPWKTKYICGWAVYKGYDYVFLCDTDTFLIPSLLLQSGFENFDYSGQFGTVHPVGQTFHYTDAHGDYPVCHPWASGGVGYFLSNKAAQLVSIGNPDVWAEDMFVGQVLGSHIQTGLITASDLPIECRSAWHFPRRKFKQPYDPKFKWMETMYAEHEK